MGYSFIVKGNGEGEDHFLQGVRLLDMKEELGIYQAGECQTL